RAPVFRPPRGCRRSSSSARSLSDDELHGLDDSVVGAAAAEVSAHALAHLVVLRRGRDRARNAGPELAHHPERRADLAGCAIAALEAVAVDEGLLERMQLAVRREPFDRRDRAPVVLDREREAAVDALAV